MDCMRSYPFKQTNNQPTDNTNNAGSTQWGRQWKLADQERSRNSICGWLSSCQSSSVWMPLKSDLMVLIWLFKKCPDLHWLVVLLKEEGPEAWAAWGQDPGPSPPAFATSLSLPCVPRRQESRSLDSDAKFFLLQLSKRLEFSKSFVTLFDSQTTLTRRVLILFALYKLGKRFREVK